VIDAAEVERRTGWRVVALGDVASTNDEAAKRAPGDGARLAVVAERQTTGRGRGGARFHSPPGGLYASLAFRVRAADVPAPLVAAAGVAVARAIERVAPVQARLKWPNDVWVEGRKVAGILVEASMGGRSGGERPGSASDADAVVDAVVGVGVNVARVPDDLPASVREETTALDAHAPGRVRLEDVLSEVLLAASEWVDALRAPGGKVRVETEYRERAALLGRRISYRVGDREESGVLRDVSLERGLLVESERGEAAWRPMPLVRQVRPSGPRPATPGGAASGDTFVTGAGEPGPPQRRGRSRRR
jgi:BirA family biotin operon repressor/biotin-[acetyl-CoA-carboxylase] ligase